MPYFMSDGVKCFNECRVISLYFKHNIIGFCPGVETIRLPVGESPPRSSQGFPAALSTMQKPSKKLKNNLWLGITAHSSD
tara:strand:- start:1174 stop:1413 length:240 start_codon:yes stop_codon:yes gene_type:complete